jgi:putative transposase
VSKICQVLRVSRSGYYAWRTRPETRRDRANRDLLAEIRHIHRGDGKVYGSPRVYKELREKGISCSENRISRIMRVHNIRAQQGKRYRRPVMKTASAWIAPNVLAGQFKADRANQIWLSDITYIHTRQGWLYLAVVMDLFSRRIIGWSMSKRITAQISIDALEMALLNRNPSPDTLLNHSDRGIHYACKAYQERLRQKRIRASMSRRGHCFDNAVVESFFSSLKKECVYRTTYQTRAKAREELFTYIEMFYNRKRRHSALSYLSPLDYEATSR